VTAPSLPRTTNPDASPLRGLSAAANAFDVFGVVIVFFLIGLGLDTWLGTRPWFMLALTVVGIVGSFARAWFAYSAEMDRLDAERRAPVATRSTQAGQQS